MISLRLKTSLYILVSGFLLGFCMAIFFVPEQRNSETTKHLPATTNQLQKQANAIKKDYQNRIAALEDQNNQLQSDLSATEALLDQTKQVVKEKENKIKKIVAGSNVPPKSWSFENYGIPIFDAIECDSLKNEVTGYIAENHRKDSLYEMQLSTMDSVVSVKDSIIHNTEGLYNSLHQVYDQAIAIQQSLQSENSFLKKKAKRVKVKNRLLATGLLVISGSVIHFIHH